MKILSAKIFKKNRKKLENPKEYLSKKSEKARRWLEDNMPFRPFGYEW